MSIYRERFDGALWHTVMRDVATASYPVSFPHSRPHSVVVIITYYIDFFVVLLGFSVDARESQCKKAKGALFVIDLLDSGLIDDVARSESCAISVSRMSVCCVCVCFFVIIEISCCFPSSWLFGLATDFPFFLSCQISRL